MLRNFLRTTLFTTVGVLILLAGSAHADLVLSPPEVNPGEQYRLVFASSTTKTSASSLIGDYNDFVQGLADASGLSVLNETWKAIGSTADDNARDNTSTTGTGGVRIFRTDGTKLADDYGDLWDGSIDAQLRYTEAGNEISTGIVWTGTSTSGVADNPLGSGFVTFGSVLGTDSTWISLNNSSSTGAFHIYAISGVITAIPEPSAFFYLSLVGLGCVGCVVARKKFACGS